MAEHEPSDIEVAIARQKSYVAPAGIVFILYWIFWIPGLMINLVLVEEMACVEDVAGKRPMGATFLQAQFLFGLIPLALYVNLYRAGVLEFLFDLLILGRGQVW